MRTVRRWRGLKALLHDAVDATVDLVGEGHESTARTVRRVTDAAPAIREPARAIDALRRVSTHGVLGAIKVTNRALEAVTDAGLDVAERALLTDATPPAPVPMRDDAPGGASWLGDAALGLVNAAVGHHLHEKDNGLGLSMVLRAGDRYVAPEALGEALPEASPRVALFVHGLGTTEWSWCLEAEAYHGDPGASFGSLLARDLGVTPLWLRYNTGRHVSENGRELAALLERVRLGYPGGVEELTLVGHSMGGLVVRSACHYGEQDGLQWPSLVRHAFYLGSPHRGAPLAKLAHALDGVLEAIDLPGTRITSRVLRGRSHGIGDLRHGAIVDEDWLAPLPEASSDAPLLSGARHYFVSATLTEDAAHPLGRLAGDLLVRVPSASGPALRAQHSFPIDTVHRGGVLHHQLQNHPAVYAQLLEALRAP
ncbi:MAG: alpha/beta hydrolase [Sandaracinaceae bacterium]|nr:alpha/beta hydrolase [Sandaracinaceae bacterium]